jgi:hypothetical protein
MSLIDRNYPTTTVLPQTHRRRQVKPGSAAIDRLARPLQAAVEYQAANTRVGGAGYTFGPRATALLQPQFPPYPNSPADDNMARRAEIPKNQ